MVRSAWPDHVVVWRWHFYAGLLCIPFVLWLAVTGALYLFKPQIDAWLDRPYGNLELTGHAASPSAQVAAAVAAVPGSVLSCPLSREQRSRCSLGAAHGCSGFMSTLSLDDRPIFRAGAAQARSTNTPRTRGTSSRGRARSWRLCF